MDAQTISGDRGVTNVENGKVQADKRERKGEANGRNGSDVLGEQVLIGQVIRQGIEPPKHLEADVLMEGAAHWFFGESESGKTWLMLWLIKRRIEAGNVVLYFDKENGAQIIGERLAALGCDPHLLDELLVYRQEPNLRLDEHTLDAYILPIQTNSTRTIARL